MASLSQGIPVYSLGPSKELATPTGVALLRTMATGFGPLPLMRHHAVGCGAGTATFANWPNVLRVFIGERELEAATDIDSIVQLRE